MNERAKRINEAIEKSGYSYAELSELTGVSKSSLQRYATGETKKIPIDCIEKIAAATRTDARYLMCWDDDFIETHEFLKTITDPDHTSVQVKEQDAYIDELIAQNKKSAPADDGESKEIKEVKDKLRLLSDAEIIELSDFIDYLLSRREKRTDTHSV